MKLVDLTDMEKYSADVVTAAELALEIRRIANAIEEFNRMFEELANTWNHYGVPVVEKR